MDMDELRPRLKLMSVRLLALLLAIVVAAGAASPVLAAAPDAVSQIDDSALDPEPALACAAVALVVPARRELPQIVAPREPSLGRLHAAWVFRPPR